MPDYLIDHDIILNGFSSCICVVQRDADLTISYANPAFYQTLGYTKEELQYRYASRMSALLDTQTSKKLQDIVAGRYKKSSISLEHTLKGSISEQWFLSEVNYSKLEENNCIYFISHNIDRFKTIEYTLASMEKQGEYVFDNADFDMLEYDWMTGAIRTIKSRWFALGKLQKGDSFVERMVEDNMIHPDDCERFSNCINGISKKNSRILLELKVKAPNGTYKWARLSIGCLKYGRRVSGVCIFTDISAEKEATGKYLEETFFYQSMLSDQNAFGHVDVSQNRLLRVGGMWDSFSPMIDTMPFDQLFMDYKDQLVHPEDRAHYTEFLNVDALIDSFHNGIIHLGHEFRRIMEQNVNRWMEMTIHLFSNPLNQHVMALIYLKNIDEQKKERLALEHRFGWDALTHAYNRVTAEEYIKEHLVDMEPEEICCFLILDIDNFALLNDEYNHEMGNEVLIKVKQILREAFRKRDILGRYGSDEFIVFLKDVDYLDNIKMRLNEVIEYIEREVNPRITGSIGITIVRKGDVYEDIFHQADEALYRAKILGKNRYVMYQEMSEGVGDNTWDAKRSARDDEMHMYGGTTVHAIDSLVGQYGDIAYMVNPRTYELLCGNQAFYNRIGKAELECSGMKCYELMHNRKRPCPFCRSANWNGERFYMYRNYNEVLEQEFLIKNKLVTWKRSQVLLTIAVDLSNDKNLTGSLDHHTMENGCILSGIQHMQEAKNLDEVIYNAMEAIGSFFRGDRVRFWKKEEGEPGYTCAYSWFTSDKESVTMHLTPVDETMVGQWIHERKWTEFFYAESQEVMLCNSYDMYHWMKNFCITNQYWKELKDETTTIGFFEIDNIKMNFRNVSFLNSFFGFIAGEWQKRILLDDIIYINYHDGLTGALNRSSYERCTHKYSADNVSTVAVVVVNINGLKYINDRLGVEGGNLCLKSLAQIMTLVYGQSQVFRINGDEFLALMTNVSQRFVEERIEAMEELIYHENRFTVASGYSWDDVERNLGNTVEYATHAMHLNKKRCQDLEIMRHKDRADILTDILNVIDGKRMEVYLQPKMDIRLNRMVGAEALVRMHHKEHGITPPSKFIDVLEKNHLIRYVDLYVFEEVCKMLERWKKEGRECPQISVNFSRLTLMEHNLPQTIDGIFNKYNISKSNIEIEITESFEEGGRALLYQAVQELFKAGYIISLDDFGTKYTNLSILSDTDVNVLKIDKSLIYSLVENKKNQIILKNIINMCNELSIEVIAEGVETKEQEDVLRQMGCYMIQGYLYSKPIPIPEFEEKFM